MKLPDMTCNNPFLYVVWNEAIMPMHQGSAEDLPNLHVFTKGESWTLI
jgi:hypothetical protein